MTRYPSKIGPELVIPIASLLLGAASLMAYQKTWPGLFFILLVIAFVVHIFLTTSYTIEDRNLKIRSGFLFKKTVPIDSIKKIQDSSVALSSPAMSLKRLEICYNTFDSVLISPKDREGFIKHLLSVNPEIETHLH